MSSAVIILPNIQLSPFHTKQTSEVLTARERSPKPLLVLGQERRPWGSLRGVRGFVREQNRKWTRMASDGEKKERKRSLLVSPVAKPLAGKKLTKKSLKVVKRAAKTKQLRRGVKEVVKALKKGQKGLCIIAGDISPIDVITHVPILCEEADVPYIYVPSKEDLGAAGSTKRPTSCALIVSGPIKGDFTEEDKEKFKTELEEVVGEIRALGTLFI